MIEVRQDDIGTALPVVRLAIEGTRAVTVLLAFDAGARTERAEENGMAHFLEHLVFKGGETWSTPREVNTTAERLGAQLNAYTSHDLVAFHITCRAEAVMDAADLLTDFVARAHLSADDLERERGVVVQEIARSDDQPASVASKLLDRAVFGDHPLGRPVLGPAEHIRGFSRDAMTAFRERRWAAGHGGAFLAGDLSGVNEHRLAGLLHRFPAREDPPPADPAPGFEPRVLVERRDSAQSHLRLHWRPEGDPHDLRRRAALRVYAISAGGSSHADLMSLDVASGLESAKCAEAYRRIREIVDDLQANGPTSEEVERARAYAAGSTVLALEGTNAVARRAASSKVLFGEVISPDADIAALDAVSYDDVRDVARSIGGPPAVACVGPHDADEFA